ncbi:MAG: DNA mismatch repair protein MutS [Candidatus Heritagella sp.]|nr:DNA mismatch repair protein MutS [Candidatus Heritagella sp.]
MAKDLSPMMQQYFKIKEQYPDTILFFRLGDFYEMFFDDAKLVSRELELTLTGRDCGLSERAPMCGVPFHSYESYLARLVSRGYKVAICEQLEDPALAKGLVKRDIIRVVTPGTVLENSMLEEGRNNYLCSLYLQEQAAGCCFADISTGEARAIELRGEDLLLAIVNELGRFSPSEILLSGQFSRREELCKICRDKFHAAIEQGEEEPEESCLMRVKQQFHMEDGDLPARTICRAAGVMLLYLQKTQRVGLERMNTLSLFEDAQYMQLDGNTRYNLELCETMRTKEKKGSLLWVLDHTCTAMGKRLLRTWIEQPLLSPGGITRRQNAVEELVQNAELLDTLQDGLNGIYDLERILTRIVYGSANGRELRSLWSALLKIPALKQSLAPCQAALLQKLREDLDELLDITDLIDRAIEEDPPFSIREGGIIRKGYSEELDALRGDMNGGKELLADVEKRERERTGIPKLKIGYNRVFGYYIEVSNSFKNMVPADYIRRQTLTNGERFVTEELKQLESRILGAGERSVILEGRLFDEVRRRVSDEMNRVQRTAHAVAQLDVLASLARTAVRHNYARPQVDLSGKLILRDSRHPVVECLLEGAPFVPNDVTLDEGDNRVAIITGPNMAGKSTYMRQTALIVLMAQIGSFVPASYAQIGIVDSIFTRVGASDDLAAGQSTFMVEMTEVAEILRHATCHSLLILDEIGRGTSTFDGMSIAQAVLEYAADPKTLGAKTMFATHYHELTVMEEKIKGVKNYNIAVRKHGEDITFLRRIVPGGADDSFGIEVARLAGVPDKVVRRARQILKKLESAAPAVPDSHKKDLPPDPGQEQLILSSPAEGEILRRLKNMDVNALTPIECMNLLYELSRLAR